MLEFLESIIPIAIPSLAGLILLVFIISRYKVARIDQALIITGAKHPKIIRSGGGIVWPIIRKFTFFDLCIRTIVAEGDIIKTTTGVPIVVNWTAQIRPNADEEEELRIAATSFLERKDEEISRDIKFTLDGGVREVVAAMGPEAVLREKEEFSKRVRTSVAEEMRGLGFLLVSLNIQDVTDKQGYYDDLAARDREGRRREAANIRAEAEQAIREKKAEAEQAARQTELQSELAIAERTRDMEVQAAAYKEETDRAKANADIAGKLQETERQRDLIAKQGQAEVERQEQANLAATKEKAVIATRAEAEKQRLIIESEASAEQAKIDAEAQAAVVQKTAEGRAKAAKAEAEGKAEAVKLEAAAGAEAIKLEAVAEAERVQKTGSAEAGVISQKGLAEAEAIKAKGLAEAEAERALAEARAGNDKVNFDLAKLEIERDTRIQIATSVATVMASIGEKAHFIDMGGSKDESGDVLTNVLGRVPELMKKLDVQNMALNGKPATDTINELVSSVVAPLGVLNKETRVVSPGATDTAHDAEDDVSAETESGVVSDDE